MTAAILVALSALVVSGTATAIYLRAMSDAWRLELPNERDMHLLPVPSGAGIAIVAPVLLLWPIAQGFALERGQLVLLAAVVILAIVSLVDDHRPVSPLVRLAAHALTVTLLLATLDPGQRALPALPLVIERVALGLAWLWFINLYNFMDGIDGLAGCEAIAVGAGYFALVAAIGVATPLGDLALVLTAATAGYLVWNWHPARVFMGDTGSIALGFLLGWLMIDLACRGLWAASLILPLYFAADATLTLLDRLRRGKTPWQPHREHFYQRAVLGGADTPSVVWRVNAANALLIVLALLSVRFPILALVAAALTVTALLVHLRRLAADGRA